MEFALFFPLIILTTQKGQKQSLEIKFLKKMLSQQFFSVKTIDKDMRK